MRIVLALGGNAISREGEKGDIPDQVRNSRNTAAQIADLVQAGHELIVTHGNGPQVGNILRRSEAARDFLYPIPLDICGAHTQGGMGYVLQREIINAFRNRGITDRRAFTIVTQALVDAGDPAFENPTKPIGPFFTREKIAPMIEQGWVAKEDAGRGWRRMVPSPRPIAILEDAEILMALGSGHVIICCGGGGVPVMEKDGVLHGIEAVIDKDFASSLLAREIDADLMIITTGTEKVAVRFKQLGQRWLDRMTVSEARRHHEAGEFPPGSMGPKISAAIEFTEATGNDVIITLPEKTMEAVSGKAGTRIVAG
ncbi:MAG TPA: carbamate kinase [Desulfobacteraceae bacterium]|nr:carbamate kinase [Desulfobacteraceae bacterium]